MRKSVSVPLVATASMRLASPTFAQSKVTLFGLIDEGFNYLSRGPLDFGANFRLERSRLHAALQAVPNKY